MFILEYFNLALQSGISEDYLLLLTSLFNFGSGFKNSKLFFSFPFPCCFLFITKVQLERGRETEILLCFGLSVGPKSCASEKLCCSPKGHPSLLLRLVASPPYMRENPQQYRLPRALRKQVMMHGCAMKFQKCALTF